ncbi:MAG: hypothetical protein FJ308_11100 [Planctomycetes bacterium]|nr:hypothetical protein [Planctomycetota bacterium]
MSNSPTNDPMRELDRGLLERGRLALATLQYEEQAARYRAAYAALLEAISDAEQGNESRLRQWLDNRIDLAAIPDNALTNRSTLLSPPHSETHGNTHHEHAPTHIVTGQRVDSHGLDCKTPLPNDRTKSTNESTCSKERLFSEIRPLTSCLWENSTTSNLWEVMDLAAKERLLYWSPPKSNSPTASRLRTASPSLKRDRNHRPQRHPKSLLGTNPTPESATKLDAARSEKPCTRAQPASTSAIHTRLHEAQRATPRQNTKSKRRPIASPDLWISVIVHGFLLLCFSFWVIAIARPNAVLSISASNIETDEVLLETPLESPTSLDAIESTSIPTPEWKPPAELLPSPQASPSLENLSIGPAPLSAQTVASSMFGQSLSAMGAGTKLLEGAEFFGSKAVGNTFVYVVDSSPSMRRDGAFEAAKEQIIRSLNAMKPKQRYHISFFGGELESMTFRGQTAESSPIPANPENLSKTMEWIGRIKIQRDGRPPIDALQSAIAMQPDGIFLLFDGDTKVDNWTTKIREMNRTNDFLSDGGPKVPIHVIHFFRDEFEKSMRTLASENNGTYRFMPRPQKSPFLIPTP